VVFWPLDDIELVDWTTTNKFASLWFWEDIHHSSILKLAIMKAIQKSPNWNLSSKLFEDDSNEEKNQFVGFVSSHKKGTLLTSFHIHSFVVFHTDLQKNTIVTCTLTSWNHMMSNMQDRLLHLMQLIQYWSIPKNTKTYYIVLTYATGGCGKAAVLPHSKIKGDFFRLIFG
jgi:hypothetical protein